MESLVNRFKDTIDIVHFDIYLEAANNSGCAVNFSDPVGGWHNVILSYENTDKKDNFHSEVIRLTTLNERGLYCRSKH